MSFKGTSVNNLLQQPFSSKTLEIVSFSENIDKFELMYRKLIEHYQTNIFAQQENQFPRKIAKLFHRVAARGPCHALA